MNSQAIINNTKEVSNKKKYFMVFVCMFMQAIPFGIDTTYNRYLYHM